MRTVYPSAATISATNAFSASAAVDTQIPRNGFITELPFLLEAQYDNSGGPTFYSDVWDRYITSLVVAGDGRQFVNLADLRLLVRQLGNIKAEATQADYSSFKMADTKLGDDFFDAACAAVWALTTRGAEDVPAVIAHRTQTREQLLGVAA